MLAMKGCPGLFLNHGKTVGIVGDAPSMRMGVSCKVTFALRHQCILGRDQTAFDSGRLIGMKGIKTTHDPAPLKAQNMQRLCADP
jgi:hypothetical protein